MQLFCSHFAREAHASHSGSVCSVDLVVDLISCLLSPGWFVGEKKAKLEEQRMLDGDSTPLTFPEQPTSRISLLASSVRILLETRSFEAAEKVRKVRTLVKT